MSSHSVKARNRHPEPTTYARERFEVGHVTFEIVNHPENGLTFALIAGLAVKENDRRPLFTGHVEPTMAWQLRKLATRLDEIAFENMRG